MALPKPPKDFYNLEEVAEEWGWSINDIFDYAEQNKIQLSVIIRTKVRAFPVPYVGGSEAPTALAKFVTRPDRQDIYEGRQDDPYFEIDTLFPYHISGIYPIPANSINSFRLPYETRFELSVPDSKEEFPIVKFWKVDWNPKAGVSNKINLQMLIITHEEKIRFQGCRTQKFTANKSEHIKSGMLNLNGDQEASGNPTPNAQKEAFPGLPGESPLLQMVGIAGHLGKSPDYLSRSWKKDGYPINKDPKGRLYAYPSQLDAWRSSQTKK